jgi:hypothetical protein
MPDEKSLKTKGFLCFIEASREFCSFIETKQCDSGELFLVETQALLLNLYSLALHLPAIDSNSNPAIELNKEKLIRIRGFISERVPYQYYWQIFDPRIETDKEGVCEDLVDDLADMYIDIKGPLLLFETKAIEAQNEAAWQFKWGFQHHWGNHCINALRAIHYFLNVVS